MTLFRLPVIEPGTMLEDFADFVWIEIGKLCNLLLAQIHERFLTGFLEKPHPVNDWVNQ